MIKKRILLPTDFSENASNAIFYGLSLFGDEACKFTLLHTYYIPFTYHEMPLSMRDIRGENAERHFNVLIERIHSHFPDNNFEFETAYMTEELIAMVKKTVNEGNIDLVVMGTQGASGLEEVLIGSRTATAVRHVNCPVLAVPEQAPFKAPETIVLAIDDAEELKEDDLTVLLEIARKYGSHVLLLHVSEEEAKPFPKDKLDAFFKDIEHSYHTIYDKDIPQAIESFVKEKNAALVAMVSHKLNLFERIFHQSITRKMVFHTEIPLLAMPAKK